MDFHLTLDVLVKDVPADFDRHLMAKQIFFTAYGQAMQPNTEGGGFTTNDGQTPAGGWEIEMTGE